MLSDLYITLKNAIVSNTNVDSALVNLTPEEHRTILTEQDARGITLMHWAVEYDNLAAVNVLLSLAGENLDAILSAGDNLGDTPLHIALAKGKQVLAQVILSKMLENDSLLSKVLSLPNEYETTPVDLLLLSENKETFNHFIAQATKVGLLNKVGELKDQEGVTLQDKLASEEFANHEVRQLETATVVEEKNNASEEAVTIQPLTGVDLAQYLPNITVADLAAKAKDLAQYLPNITIADLTAKAKDLGQYLPNITVADLTAKAKDLGQYLPDITIADLTAKAKDLGQYSPNITISDFTTLAPRDVISKELLGATLAGWEFKQSKAFITKSTQYDEVIAELEAHQAGAAAFDNPPVTPPRGPSSSAHTPPSSNGRSSSRKNKQTPQKQKIDDLDQVIASPGNLDTLQKQQAVKEVKVAKAPSKVAENVFYVASVAHQMPQFLNDVKWLASNVGYDLNTDQITATIDTQLVPYSGIADTSKYIVPTVEIGSLLIMSMAAKSPFPLVFFAAQTPWAQNYMQNNLEAESLEYANIALSGVLIASVGMVSVPGAITLLTIHAASSALTYAIDHEKISADNPLVLARPVLEAASHSANVYYSPYAVLKIMATLHSAHALENEINNNFEHYKIALGVTAEELSALRDKIASWSMEKSAIAQEWTSGNWVALKTSGSEKYTSAQEWASENWVALKTSGSEKYTSAQEWASENWVALKTSGSEKYISAQEWTSENWAALITSGSEKSAIAQEFAQERFAQTVAYVEASKEVSENPVTAAWSGATLGGINKKIGASPAKIFKSALVLDKLPQLLEDLKVLGVKLPVEQYKIQLEGQLEIQIPESYIKPAIAVGSGLIMSLATKNAFPAFDALLHTATGQRLVQENLSPDNQIYANAGYIVVTTGVALGLGWFTAPVAAVCVTMQLTDLGLDYALSHSLIPLEYQPYAISAKPALDMVSQVASIALNPLKIVKAIEFIHLVREGFEYSQPYHESVKQACWEVTDKYLLHAGQEQVVHHEPLT